MAFSQEFRFRFSKWLTAIPFIWAVGLIIFCFHYLYSSYNDLSSRYLAAQGCFYRNAQWTSDFFTSATKSAGNKYCISGIALSLLLMAGSIRHWRKHVPDAPLKVHFDATDFAAICLLLLLGGGLWLTGFLNAVPAYDEVFSAVNCAGAGPGLSLTYYMLPNNHVLFNVLNGALFGWVSDNIISGRVISGLAFAGFTILLYVWMRGKLGQKGYAVLYCAVLMLQFPVWGFSFQARGYSIYLLCAWASLIMLEYYLEHKNQTALAICAAVCVIGFGVMPSFLFWFAAIGLIVCFSFLYKKRIDKQLILKLAVIPGCVFLFYLPVICYSGLPALTDNEYVRVAHPTWPDFWANFKSGFDATIRYCFASDVDGHSVIYPILFSLPLLLLPLFRKSRTALYVLTCLGIWMVFLLLQMKFRHYPFMRNMIAHCSVTLAVLLLAIHFSAQKIFRQSSLGIIRHAVPIIFCAVCAMHFIKYMRDNMGSGMYFYDTKGRYNDQRKMLSSIPKHASVWTSDESFFPRYILSHNGAEASHCYNGQQYFIVDKTLGEIPPVSLSVLRCIDSANQYLVYKIK